MGIYWPEDRIDDVFGSAYPPVNGVDVCMKDKIGNVDVIWE